MGVSSVTFRRAGASGLLTGSGGAPARKEYQAEFNVLCSSARDDSQIIFDHFLASGGGLPFLGSPYVYGDGADAFALCQKMEADRVDDSLDRWIVRCTYATPEDDGGGENPTVDGQATDDPLLWHTQIHSGATQTAVPCWRAVYLGGFKGRADALRGPFTSGPIVNSAMVPYDPTLENELNIEVLSFARYFGRLDAIFVPRRFDVVNSTDFAIDQPAYGLSRSFAAQTVRSRPVSASFEIVNRRAVWKVTAEFHIHPDTWVDELPDRGLVRRALHGDQKGDGTTRTSSDVPAQGPFVEKILDEQGVPLSEPVLLDGDGQPLNTELMGEAVWIRYMKFDGSEYPRILMQSMFP